MELIMKLALLAGGLALVIVPRSFIKKLSTYRPAGDRRSEPVAFQATAPENTAPRASAERSLAGPRLVGAACVVLALLSLVI